MSSIIRIGRPDHYGAGSALRLPDIFTAGLQMLRPWRRDGGGEIVFFAWSFVFFWCILAQCNLDVVSFIVWGLRYMNGYQPALAAIYCIAIILN